MRVLMEVGPRDGIRRDWARAARLIADVICVQRVNQLSVPALSEVPFLAARPEDDGVYQFLRPNKRKLPRQRIPGLGAVLDRQMAARDAAMLKYLERRHGTIDLVHFHGFVRSRHLPLVARRTGIPYIVREYDGEYTRSSPVNLRTKQGRRDVARVYGHASSIICPSGCLKRMLISHGVSGDYYVVPNPIDMSLFKFGVSRPPEDKIEVVSVGRLVPTKGHDILLRAFAHASEHEPRLRLTIIGSGSEERELVALRSRLGLDGKVAFAGRLSREDVADHLERAHFFALATQMEAFGVVFIEAMASGLPIVATNVGPIAEIVDSDSGILAEPNTEGICRALLRMAKEFNRFDRQEISSRAQKYYSYDRVAADLKCIYSLTVGRA